jgi:hypothetical protein
VKKELRSKHKKTELPNGAMPKQCIQGMQKHSRQLKSNYGLKAPLFFIADLGNSGTAGGSVNYSVYHFIPG